MRKDFPPVKSREWNKARNDEIKRLWRDRYSAVSIAKKFKISHQRVFEICNGLKRDTKI
jgi:Mor family transcriptional regulator